MLRTFQRAPGGQQNEIFVSVQIVRVFFYFQNGIHHHLTVNGTVNERGSFQTHPRRVLDPSVLFPAGNVPRLECAYAVAPTALLVHALDNAVASLTKAQREIKLVDRQIDLPAVEWGCH